MGDLIFRASFIEVLIVTLLFIGTVFLIVRSQRTPKSFLNTLAMVFKVLATSALAFLLLKPEVRKELPQETDLELVILKDKTPSMAAQDVPLAQELLSRADALASFLDEEAWDTFLQESNFSIKERSFGEGEEETDLGEALEMGAQADAVLLLSDGAWNRGMPPMEIAQKLRKEGVKVFSLALGAEDVLPDLFIEKVEAPLIVETAEPFSISVQVKSTFEESRTSRVLLRIGDEVIEELSVELNAGERKEVSFGRELAEEGTQGLSVEVIGVEGEASLENNREDFTITARKQVLNVLLVDTLPRWEYRYIRNAMMRDPKVDVSCLLLHPNLPPGGGPHYITSFPEDLSSYDVILLGDIGIGKGQLRSENAQAIVQAVKKNATGLILLPGANGWQNTLHADSEFKTLYPVDDIQGFKGSSNTHLSGLKLSEEGQRSLLLSLHSEKRKNAKIWELLPGFAWYQPVSTVKAGSTVLAYHESDRSKEGRIPIIVTGKAGRGKVLWMGMDSSWKWRRGVEDLYHYRYWRQMARWMAYQRNLTEGEQAKIFLSAENPIEGGVLSFSLHAMTAEGQPAQPADVRLLSYTETGEERLIPFSTTSNWGEFKGELLLDESGLTTLKVVVNDQEIGKREIQVKELRKETVGEPADYSSLQELSRVSEGVSYPFSQRLELIPFLSLAETPSAQYEFVSLYSHWLWYMMITVFLVTAWILRRLSTGE